MSLLVCIRLDIHNTLNKSPTVTVLEKDIVDNRRSTFSKADNHSAEERKVHDSTGMSAVRSSVIF